jgi:hypothetical protein
MGIFMFMIFNSAGLFKQLTTNICTVCTADNRSCHRHFVTYRYLYIQYSTSLLLTAYVFCFYIWYSSTAWEEEPSFFISSYSTPLILTVYIHFRKHSPQHWLFVHLTQFFFIATYSTSLLLTLWKTQPTTLVFHLTQFCDRKIPLFHI